MAGKVRASLKFVTAFKGSMTGTVEFIKDGQTE